MVDGQFRGRESSYGSLYTTDTYDGHRFRFGIVGFVRVRKCAPVSIVPMVRRVRCAACNDASHFFLFSPLLFHSSHFGVHRSVNAILRSGFGFGSTFDIGLSMAVSFITGVGECFFSCAWTYWFDLQTREHGGCDRI